VCVRVATLTPTLHHAGVGLQQAVSGPLYCEPHGNHPLKLEVKRWRERAGPCREWDRVYSQGRRTADGSFTCGTLEH
jgi:hypothetical protein